MALESNGMQQVNLLERPSLPPHQLSPAAVRQLALQIAQQLRPKPERGRTFGEACASWLANASRRVEDTRNETRHVELLQPLALLTEAELTPKRVRAHLDSLVAPQGELSAMTVNMLRAKGRKIVREAQLEEEWGALNPFDLAPRYKQTRPEHHRVTLEEARAFLPRLRRDRWREAVLALLLGPRPGEVKALRREDVNLARGEVTFRRSNKRNKTKTGKPRTLPIPAQLRPALEEALREAVGELVFPEADGSRQRADKNLSRSLRAAYARAGLVAYWVASCRRKGCGWRERREVREEGRCPECGFKLWLQGKAPDVRWYDLRHAAATLHQEAGCLPEVVRRVLGHSARSTTEKVYTHFSLNFMRRELERLQLFPTTPE